MLSRRTFLAAAGAGSLVVSPAATAAVGIPSGKSAPTQSVVEGYIQSWDASAVDIVRRNAGAMTLVGLAGPALINKGSALQENPTYLAEVARAAKAQGKRTELVVSNFEVGGDGFSQASLDGLLTSAQNQRKVAAELVQRAKALGANGVQIDFEEMKAVHASGLTAFVRVLRQALPASMDLSMAVSPYGTVKEFPDNGWVFKDLNASITRYVLMSYVERGEWTPYGEAGPIGSLEYLRSSANGAMSAGMPAAKLVLGSSGMGFAWRPGRTGELTSYEEIVRLAGSRATYRADIGEWTATLDDGTILWWSDSRSLATRVATAKALGVAGIAVWSLNTSAPLR